MAVRVISILVGGYALTGGITALGGIGLHAAGLPLSDSMLLTSMLGYLLYVGIVIWGFGAPPKYHPSATIVASAVATMGLAAILSVGVINA